MKWLWQLIKFIVPTIFVAVLHFFVINFLPYPFNHINIIYFAVLWLIIISSKVNFFILAICVLFVSELFSSLPFGITAAAMLISLMIAHWFLLNIFTNRSAYMVLLSAFLGILLFRIIFFFLLGTYNLFAGGSFLPTMEVLVDALWEVVLTPCALLIFYFFASKLTKRLDPNYISFGKGKSYG